MAIKAAIALACVTVLGVCSYAALALFAYGDERELEKFVTAYENFDAAVSQQAVSEAGDALGSLKSMAEVRLSSAIKNDARLMQAEHQIVDLAGQEVGRLGTYEAAIRSPAADVETVARSFSEVTNQRKAAYTHFQILMGVKPISQ